MSDDTIYLVPSEGPQFPPVTDGAIGDHLVQTVNARDLHAFLGVGSAFKDWFSRRVADYAFSEGADFCSFLSESGGRPSKEYAIALDMAKELAMVERNDQGRAVRRYFIECERRAKASGPDAIAALNDPAAMRHMLLTYAEKAIALEGKIEEMRPQIQAFERIAVSDGSLCITDAAKTLQARPKDLFAFLRANGWIYSRAGTATEVAYQPRLADGSLEHKTNTVLRSDGSEKTVTQVRVTPKGLTKLAKLLPPIVRGV